MKALFIVSILWVSASANIYGASSNPNNIDLAHLNVTEGFVIEGARALESVGNSVSSAGDINGDGLDDMIIGAPYLDSTDKGNQESGAYVIYGKKGIYPAIIDLAHLNATQGFNIIGAKGDVRIGFAVSSAGDINGDGFSDLLVGATFSQPHSRSTAGATYILYGQKNAYPLTFNLTSLYDTQGFIIEGSYAGDELGGAVSSVGDINRDGFGDFIIGANLASPKNRFGAGESYVIYGQKGYYPLAIDLRYLNATQGFSLFGAAQNDFSGFSVHSAGDINGDGFSDFVIGAETASPKNREMAGASYVIYGRNEMYFHSVDLAHLNVSTGFMIQGAAAGDECGSSVGSAGDINGDGLSDVIVGSPIASPQGRSQAGITYVIYGQKGMHPKAIDLAQFDKTQGVIIVGAKDSDWSGSAVSSAGDFNGGWHR